MSSRPKRVIKAKKKDDEIYTSITKRMKSSPSRVARREAASGETKEKHGKSPLKRKKIKKSKITDVNAAIYKRLQESLKAESNQEGSDDDEALPKKRIPKPSLKLKLEEASSDDYLPSDESDADSEEIEYEPRKTPKKSRNGSVKTSKIDSSKRIEIHKRSFPAPSKRLLQVFHILWMRNGRYTLSSVFDVL